MCVSTETFKFSHLLEDSLILHEAINRRYSVFKANSRTSSNGYLSTNYDKTLPSLLKVAKIVTVHVICFFKNTLM